MNVFAVDYDKKIMRTKKIRKIRNHLPILVLLWRFIQ